MARLGLLFALIVLTPIAAEAQAPQFPQPYRGAGYNYFQYQPIPYQQPPQIQQPQWQAPQSGFRTYLFPNGQMLNCNSFGTVTSCF